MNFFKRNKHLKKSIFLIVVSLVLGLSGYLVWYFHDSYYEIFNAEEARFLEAAQRYYEFRPEKLPKKNETREITLEKMFSENRIEALYVPKTQELCDTSSWVRVYHNKEGEYEYTTYLKCGKYESSVDHVGPVIELEGSNEIIINHNQAYQDPGVKSVTDDVDGKIDISKVTIDTSHVDVKTPGDYKVTYTVRDKQYNQTVVTRKVSVKRNLTEIVKLETDDSNYYKGRVDDNYLQFSGMLWRIINVNDDGSVKVMSEDAVSNLRYDSPKYQDSNVEAWLNNVFYSSITNADKYLVDTTYCVGNVTSVTDTANSCSETVTAKVGLLSIDEFYKTAAGVTSSVHYKNNSYNLLSNKLGDDVLVSVSNLVRNYSALVLPSVRPVITLKSNLYVTTGVGSLDNPYKLEDYNYGKENDKISTRIVGEYVTFSGQDFRIIDKDSDGNLKLIGVNPLLNLTDKNTSNKELTVFISNLENYQYNLETPGNPGYILNEDYIEFLDDDKIISKKYSIVTNSINKKYTEYETEAVKAKLFLASTIDLFSGINVQSARHNTVLYSDRVSAAGRVLVFDTTNGMVQEINSKQAANCALKVILYLDGDLIISSGNGTYNKPYALK